jgi:hypothetical protein
MTTPPLSPAAPMVSCGLNPNTVPTCAFPVCDYLIRSGCGSRYVGWCGHPANRVQPSTGWPTGFTPSVSCTGGCGYHSALANELRQEGAAQANQ